MSDQEPFLTRWARRKRDAAKAAPTVEPEPGVSDPPPPGGATDPVEADGVVRRESPPATGGQSPLPPVFDPTQLPSLDSISAVTDIRAFLAPGVPADLTRAALRRAWTADPAIRDFVGLADYDWDFNTPGAISGFEPLEMTEELRRQITDMVGRNIAVPQADLPADQARGDESIAQTPEPSNDIDASTPAEATQRPPPTIATSDEIAGSSRGCEEFSATIANNTAAQHSGPSTAEQTEALPRRHGRALPK